MELDGRLETRWWGAPAPGRPTIVLLHEGLGCVALWRDFPASLQAATGWPVFAYSRFGYGGSAPVTLPRPLDYMHREAALLPRILAAAGIETYVLLGHSDGATIATIAAAEAPTGLLGLVLIAPHFFVEDVTIASIEAARTAYETGDLRTRLARYHGDVDNAFRGWNDAWLDPAFRTFRIDHLLVAIGVRVLALQGDGDEYASPAQLDILRSRLENFAETCLIPGPKHSPHLTHPSVVVSMIRSFTARLAPPARKQSASHGS
jgi:pimeloyl-ACP methyl ester carboxylesterase